MNKLKDFFSRPPKRANGTHGVLLIIVGVYLIYLATQMYKNTTTGASTMSMQLTIVLMAVMILVGLAVCAYGLYVGYWGWKLTKPNGTPTEEPEELPETGFSEGAAPEEENEENQ